MESESESLLLSAKNAAKLLEISRSHFYTLNSSGRLGPMSVRLGGRVLWNRQELVKWVDSGCPPRQKWLQMNSN